MGETAESVASSGSVVVAFNMHQGFRPDYLGNTTTFTQPPGVTPHRHSPRVPTNKRSGSRAPHTAPSLSPGSLTPRTPVVLSPRVRQWAPRTARGETWSSRHQPFHDSPLDGSYVFRGRAKATKFRCEMVLDLRFHERGVMSGSVTKIGYGQTWDGTRPITGGCWRWHTNGSAKIHLLDGGGEEYSGLYTVVDNSMSLQHYMPTRHHGFLTKPQVPPTPFLLLDQIHLTETLTIKRAVHQKLCIRSCVCQNLRFEMDISLSPQTIRAQQMSPYRCRPKVTCQGIVPSPRAPCRIVPLFSGPASLTCHDLALPHPHGIAYPTPP